MTIVGRVHDSSVIIFNGDHSQTDIGNKSGFRDFIQILNNAGVLKSVELGGEFQMRHPDLVRINEEYIKFLKNKC